MPVELQLKLGKNAHVYNLSGYGITEWMIDIGGISRSLYFGGMILAHFVALRLYKAALIEDIYMV